MQVEGTAEQVAALFQALINAQAEFPPIPKTKQAYNYKYAPLPEIHKEIRPVLSKHGLAVLHPINRIDGKQLVGTTVIHTLGGRVSCEGLAVPETAKIQEQGGYVTYGERYGYCAMLGITSQDDDDAALASAKSQRQTPGAAGRGSSARRAPVALPPTGDSGANPDPSLPSKEERARYKQQIEFYTNQGIESKDLEAYFLAQSGASEARLIKKSRWDSILTRLDEAYAKQGAIGVTKLIGAN